MTAADRRCFTLSVAALLVVSACSSTKVTSEWKDVSYPGKPARILVMALTDNAEQRRIIENEVAGRLKEAGTDAVAGYTVLPGGKQPDPETVAAGVEELGADAVFLTRLLDRKAEPEYMPGTGSPYYDFYGGFYSPHAPGFPPAGYPPGQPRTQFPGYVNVEVYDVALSSLLDAETGKVIWSATSESELKDDDRNAVESYASRIVKALRKQDLAG